MLTVSISRLYRNAHVFPFSLFSGSRAIFSFRNNYHCHFCSQTHREVGAQPLVIRTKHRLSFHLILYSHNNNSSFSLSISAISTILLACVYLHFYHQLLDLYGKLLESQIHISARLGAKSHSHDTPMAEKIANKSHKSISLPKFDENKGASSEEIGRKFLD